MNIKTILLSSVIISALISPPAMAERVPKPGKADARVKTLTYHDNDVYRLRGSYGYTTTIEFGGKETIETISLGDSESWQVIKPKQQPNILFVKPLEENADTNMTVLTSKHMYTFDMSAGRAASSQSPSLAFRIKFIYPEEQTLELASFGGKSASFNPLSDTPATEWNFDYSYAGDKKLRPERVFDDGAFTYFLMKDVDVMPAVFLVDKGGNESIVNFNIQGQYLVVNRTGGQFTLRDGDYATCIFNESYKDVRGKQKTIAPIETVEKKKSKKVTSKVKAKSDPIKLEEQSLNESNEKTGFSFLSYLSEHTKDVSSDNLNQ
jgi:type IV secretion system protein VirB9